jgi:hypothetical protein
MSLAKGAAYEHSSEAISNGFVFSTAEINAAIDRDNRLKQARELNGQGHTVGKRHLTRAA